MKLADGSRLSDETLANVAAFTATPWHVTHRGAIHKNILLTPDVIRPLIALPILDSHRMILVGRVDERWVIDNGPWRIGDGGIVRESGHGLRELYLSYLLIRGWLSDYL